MHLTMQGEATFVGLYEKMSKSPKSQDAECDIGTVTPPHSETNFVLEEKFDDTLSVSALFTLVISNRL